MMFRIAVLTSVAVALVLSHVVRGQDGSSADSARRPASAVRVSTTRHPPLPGRLSEYWLVPEVAISRPASAGRPDETAAQRFARGVKLVAASDFAAGLPLVNLPALSKTPLASYAQFYTGVALLGLSRLADADAAFEAAADGKPKGFLQEALPLRIAEVAMARSDPERAVDVLGDLTGEKLVAPEAVWLQLGLASERAGDVSRALKAYRKLYYDFALSSESAEAAAGILRLQTPDLQPPDRYKLERDRAEKLFAGRRWAQARAAFEPLGRVAQGDDTQLVALRLAECDYYLDRFRAARQALVPYLDDSSREAEARFFHLSATRALGDLGAYVQLARRLVEDHPDSPWAEETLNNLASHYITVDDDESADRVFRQLARSFPRSRYAERAAWKIGWRAYRGGNFREAADTFERGAAAFPRADNRPAWLYWSGRALDRLDEPALAAERFGVVVADYQNSYYGRLAIRLLPPPDTGAREGRVVATSGVAPADPFATDALIRELIALQLYDDALREVQYAQRAWGDSPQLQATIAFIRHNQGAGLKAEERFTAVRGAITTMRRAYPQFMAAGGEDLPAEVLRIIFPLDYWSLITKYSKLHQLDPYLIAALMAQESTFTAEIRSSANAIGLMQLIPSTGRQYARKLGIRNFSTSSLTQPETNVRLGTEYFKALLKRFGGVHYALASYNAGENRVARWLAENPGLPADEFIDDIPFTETQGYVKRIMGTAEDYRRLYGGGLLDPDVRLSAAASPSASAAKPAPKPLAAAKSPSRPVPAKSPERTTPQPTRTPAPATRPSR